MQGLRLSRVPGSSRQSLLRAKQLHKRSLLAPTHVFPFSKQLEKPLSKEPAPKFKLPLAIALAGAAFESYLEPTGAEGFQERAFNGTETTFTDAEFLSEVCAGVLYVELQHATGLRVADVTGASDPYAVILVGGSTARSKVIKGTVNPVWQQSFYLYLRDPAKDFLQVRLYDEDFIKSDDDLGLARVPLATLAAGEATQLELPLTGNGGQGKVSLRVTLLKFSDAPALGGLLTADSMDMPKPGGPAQPKGGSSLAAEVHKAAAAGREASKASEAGSSSSSSGSSSGGFGLPALVALREQVVKALQGEAAAAEASDTPPSAWKVLARVAGFKAGNSWTPVAFVSNHETDTQAWLYRNSRTREVVLAFRGTEQVKWKDFATDLNLVPAAFNAERVGADGALPLVLRVARAVVPTTEVQVHQGFLSAYDSIKGTLLKLLDSATAEGSWHVYVTGHSLGGALATLAAFELAARRGPARARHSHITMYTYGAPRVGNKPFADGFNSAVRDAWRITNTADIIPTVPRLLGYAHVGHSVRLLEGGQLQVARDSSSDVFGEGKGGLEVVGELVERAQAEGGKWEEVVEGIKERELQILNTLVDGTALEQHMETFYLAALQACVVATVGEAAASAVLQSGKSGSGDKATGSSSGPAKK